MKQNTLFSHYLALLYTTESTVHYNESLGLAYKLQRLNTVDMLKDFWYLIFGALEAKT